MSMKMMAVDLNLCTNVFEAISLILYTFSYLLIVVVVLVVVVNILIYCDVFNHSEYLITLWNLTTIIYIIIIFIGLFGIPITITLEYIERLDESQINTPVVTTVWIYIFWSGLVFKFMILPFYYMYIRIFMHENNKIS